MESSDGLLIKLPSLKMSINKNKTSHPEQSQTIRICKKSGQCVQLQYKYPGKYHTSWFKIDCNFQINYTVCFT